MRIPGTKRALQAGRWLRSRLGDRALILGYHRIADVAWDPFGLCVSPKHFADQLRYLCQHASPLSLQELVYGLRHRRLPKRAVVITFDDGYLDTLVHAKPLLDRYQIPATVFVTTGAMGRAFWWDELAWLLGAPSEMPELLSITVAGHPHTWRLHRGRGERMAGWQTLESLAGELFRLMLPLDEQTREQVLAQLRIWRGVQPEAQPDSRGMTAAEVVELAAGGRIEIGAHTVTHPLLTALPLISQQVEIQRSKAHLERLLARPIHGFSYPNGSVDRGTAVCTRLAGFAYACASHTDVARMGSDHFQLPRLWAADEPAASFAPWLDHWL